MEQEERAALPLRSGTPGCGPLAVDRESQVLIHVPRGRHYAYGRNRSDPQLRRRQAVSAMLLKNRAKYPQCIL
jgi:hypothetical protein